MYKRIAMTVCFFYISLYFSGCVSAKTETTQVHLIHDDALPWDDSVGDFTDKLDIKPETAVKMAELLLLDVTPEQLKDKKRNLHKIADKDIYVISYISKENVLGGDINIAIHSKTGEVLKMWAGE